MNVTLKAILDSWEADLLSANFMADHLLQLGMPEEHMPSGRAVRESCLAIQSPEALHCLRQALLPSEQELCKYGVLRAGQSVCSMRGGELMVLNHVIGRLNIIIDLLDSVLERANSFTPPDSIIPGAPTIKIGENKVAGHKYQLANLNIKLKDVDRFLIYNENDVTPRVLIFPPEFVRLSVPIVEGELIFYAENALGAAVTRMQFTEVKYV